MIRKLYVQPRPNFALKPTLLIEGMRLKLGGEFVLSRSCSFTEHDRTLQVKEGERLVRFAICLERKAVPDGEGKFNPIAIIDDQADEQRPEQLDRAKWNVWDLGRLLIPAGADSLEEAEGILYSTVKS
jgi:hypothetical protein